MASTSSSSSRAVASPCRYDVFLSFRGEDTRDSFTDHLFEALLRAGLRTFRDNDEIERGEDLKPEIERAITESRASIVVLSKQYANSTWCLDELLLILNRRRNFSHFVLPVFYQVDPSDVKKQQKSFGDAFSMKVNALVEGFQGSPKWIEKAYRWKEALTEVANLTGMVLSGPETKFIAEIVDTIYSKLDLKLVSTPPHLTGMDSRAKYINSWLKNEQSGAEVLAICGMGGRGKTTLAKYIYNSNSQQFDSISFLEEIEKSCEQPHGLLELQEQLLMDILGGKKKIIRNISEGTSKIENALQTKKVLIVLDDVDKQDQVAALLGTKEYNTKSKIIITTRNLEIQTWFESTSRRCHKHTPELLNDHESLELLSWNAFGSAVPKEGFKEIAEKAAKYCAGNPLALKVLGSSLFVSGEDGSSTESWESTLRLLTKDTHFGIQGILRRSFDSLPYLHCREIFLHIACFFIGEDKDYVIQMLEPDYCVSAGIKTLINRCLLSVSPSNKLMMHHLLQEMGRAIIRDESPKDPAKRSRVFSNQESYDVLTKRDGSKTIEGLALDMHMLKKEKAIEPSTLTTESLAKMDKLKLLQLKYVRLIGSYKNFPELRWLSWHGFLSKTIPSNLFMRSLVAIEMSYSNLEVFEPPIVLKSLKILNLKESHKLVSIRNISRFSNLETLILWNCSRLANVCKTIGALETLALLDLTGCENLWKVSSKKYINPLKKLKTSDGGSPQLPLFPLPHSLKLLFLNNCNLGCDNLFPVNFSGQSFFHLNFGNNQFESLPNYIDLTKLKVLDLTSCPKLKSLLCLPSTLEELYVYRCVSLEKITFQSARFRLRGIGYRGCFNLYEIQGLFKLVSIEVLDETDLGHMKWIKKYEKDFVDLIGDEITEGRSWCIQMLYEFGIMSTFLPNIKDPNMASEYMSQSPLLSFRVPLCPKNRKIKGLNVTSSYRLSGEEDDMYVFTKISNTTQGLNWIYNPKVFCKPGVGEHVIWLGYWAIGNMLDIGDEINIAIVVGNGLEASECGASLVYADDEIEKEMWQSSMKWEEVLGGDLSSFQLSTGWYYLCRRDLFMSMEVEGAMPHWFKILVGDAFCHTDVKGFRKSGQSQQLNTAVKTFRGYIRSHLMKIVLKVPFDSQKCKLKAMKLVVSVAGVESVHLSEGTLIVFGDGVDVVTLVTRLRKFMMAELVSVGPNKEPYPSPTSSPTTEPPEVVPRCVVL